MEEKVQQKYVIVKMWKIYVQGIICITLNYEKEIIKRKNRGQMRAEREKPKTRKNRDLLLLRDILSNFLETYGLRCR